ncbi:copper chaperone [Desulfobaculum xiamenense]|uniref:Copper chaperone n=1 Tax=Desulfobaculum xiamenense TaxID=995050 RepID=A0A846QMC8_9BACT|nr:heavy metal-associated domain-containing protein [Desulfobaculum xiamenense]NJB67383.1 copper chaperone [Desulfobaculum xiamenense]
MARSIEVKGMSCQHCVASVTKALSAVPGVKDLKVSLDDGRATFEEASPVDMDAVRKAIAAIGFEPGETA